VSISSLLVDAKTRQFRWTRQRVAELFNLYHLARTALDERRRTERWPDWKMKHERRKWAAARFAEKYGIKSLPAYKRLTR
jgi:hypothetical protein